MTTFLKFKNLQLEANTRRGQFTHWTLFFDEVSGHEAVRFSADFVVEFNWETEEPNPVALDDNSARAIKMFVKNTENADKVLKGFFIKQDLAKLDKANWGAWKVRQKVELF